METHAGHCYGMLIRHKRLYNYLQWQRAANKKKKCDKVYDHLNSKLHNLSELQANKIHYFIKRWVFALSLPISIKFPSMMSPFIHSTSITTKIKQIDRYKKSEPHDFIKKRNNHKVIMVMLYGTTTIVSYGMFRSGPGSKVLLRFRPKRNNFF